MVQDAASLGVGTAPLDRQVPVREMAPALVWAKNFVIGAGWFAVSMGIVLGLWTLIAVTFARDLPTPWVTAHSLLAMMSRPWFVQSDGTMGVLNLSLASLWRVFMGFGVASAIAIPLGVIVGLSPLAKRLVDPVAAILRPVSPLAWFPLAQVVFRTLNEGATPAAIVGTIAICSLWPTLMNTAFGVASLPDDFRTVSRVFQFSTTRFLSKVLFPFALPHILTGLRLSLGIAWLVIVAAEMLSGQSGIGFSAYDAYNQGRLDDMLSTIIVIGFIGLLLDRGLDWIQRRYSYEEKRS